MEECVTGKTAKSETLNPIVAAAREGNLKDSGSRIVTNKGRNCPSGSDRELWHEPCKKIEIPPFMPGLNSSFGKRLKSDDVIARFYREHDRVIKGAKECSLLTNCWTTTLLLPHETRRK
jgi:hypothetical protein